MESGGARGDPADATGAVTAHAGAGGEAAGLIAESVRSRGVARITDLAGELGVSVVTVRRDVEELARRGELRRGHGVARSLEPLPDSGEASGDSVGMVIPERNTYLTEAVQGARDEAEKAGLRLALHIAADEPGAECRAVRQALEAGSRGLLLSPHWRTVADEEQDHSWLLSLEVPVVLVERRPERGSPVYGLDSVRSDHGHGVRLALDHLLALGHRRVVLAARDDSPTARVIRAEFAARTAARGIADGCRTVLSSWAGRRRSAGCGPCRRGRRSSPSSWRAAPRTVRPAPR